MTVTELRWAWTLLAAIGVIGAGWLVIDSLQSFGRVRYAVEQRLAVAWGPRWWNVLEDLGVNFGMQVVFSGFTVVGIMVVRMPPPLSGSAGEDTATAAALIFISMLVVLLAAVIWKIFARLRGRERSIRTVSVSMSRQTVEDLRKRCHDMNGNLGVVVGKVSLLEEEGGLTTDQLQELAEADTALSRLAADVKEIQFVMRSLDAVGNPRIGQPGQAGRSGKT